MCCSPVSCTKCLYRTLLSAFGWCCRRSAVSTRQKSKLLFVTNNERVVFRDGSFSVFNCRPSVAVATLRPAHQTVVLYCIIQVLLHHVWCHGGILSNLHDWYHTSSSCLGSIWIYCGHISTFGQVSLVPAVILIGLILLQLSGMLGYCPVYHPQCLQLLFSIYVGLVLRCCSRLGQLTQNWNCRWDFMEHVFTW